MKIFISWSGARNRIVAERLRQWLPDVIQSTQPWMSNRDISAGARWTPEINRQLSETKFGIICLTKSNQLTPWILFEAGALAKTIDDAFVVPYLIDMEPADIEGPLSQFQAKRGNKQETLELVTSINIALAPEGLEEERLKRQFHRAWPDLANAFNSLPQPAASPEGPRPSDDVLREVLELTRDISRRMPRVRTEGDDIIFETDE